MTEPNLDETLAQVRQAWRIVAAYQQRVFFLLDEIEHAFPELSRSHWQPERYNRTPRGTTNPSTRWVWDGLPYYEMSTWFTPSEKRPGDQLKSSEWFMVAYLCTDTGFEEAPRRRGPFSGPDPLAMPSASETQSQLWLYVYKVENGPNLGITPWQLWAKDPDWHNTPEKWSSPEKLAGISKIHWIEPLKTLFEDGGTEQFISKVRSELIEQDLLTDDPTA